MNSRYLILITVFFILIAFSRGFVMPYHVGDFFGASSAHAEGDGGGGDGGGDDGGGGDGGGDDGGGGDGGGDDGGGGDGGGGDGGGGDGGGGDGGGGAGDVGDDASDLGGDGAEPIIGCMDQSATNYDSTATSQTGVVCTYPVPPVFGCMDATATNYNPLANSQTGVICTYPIPTVTVYGCLDATATNYNPLATSQTGVICTYPVVPPVIPPVVPPVIPPVVPPVIPPSGGGGGGGGGGVRLPNVTLLSTPHTQALSYLYLSQIPYTGLDLGPVGTVLYWVALIAFALALTYLVLFHVAPWVNRRLREFGVRVTSALNTSNMPELVAVAEASITENAPVPQTEHAEQEFPEAPHGYSSYDGFKSFANNGALSVEDIVKALSRKRFVEPTHANVEPIYENVEPIVADIPVFSRRMEEPVEAIEAPVAGQIADTRGFAIALIEGDRNAVFAGLRQNVRGGGAPEKLINDIVCVLDDVYRARVDGTECDASLARMTARLSTPMLEKLIAALTTAIDSSYSSGITGAKLALTRALAVLGA